MFKRIQNLLYDVSDYLVTLIIILFIVFSIAFVLNGSLDFNWSRESLFHLFTGKQEQALLTPEEQPKTIPKQSPTTKLTPDQTKKETPPAKKIQIIISSKTSVYAFVEKLAEQGVIKNEQAFINQMIEDGYDRRLQIGTYSFEPHMTYDEIIKILFP